MRARPYLRVFVGRLRQKIEVDATRPRLLLTETGVGYRLAAPANLAARSWSRHESQ